MSQAGTRHNGRVVQIIGPAVDIEFADGHLPDIYNAVRIVSDAGATTAIDVVVEVEQHLGEGRVRTIAMKPTDGMQRGMAAIDTGAPITVPVGPGHARARPERAGRARGLPGSPREERGAVADPPPGPDARGAVDRSSRCSRPASRSSTCWSRT